MYLAIDLKSFYASVECAARGLDPLKTNLVVADAARTEKTICLAVSPSLKAYGIYIRVSTQIYQIYLKYFAPEDIHVYSIDEVFIDASP